MQIFLKYLVAILFSVFSLSAHAQDFELIKVESTYYPKQSIDGSSLDGEIGFWEWSGQFAIPQPLKNKKTIFIHKLGYSNLRAVLEASSSILNTELTKYYHTIYIL